MVMHFVFNVAVPLASYKYQHIEEGHQIEQKYQGIKDQVLRHNGISWVKAIQRLLTVEPILPGEQ